MQAVLARQSGVTVPGVSSVDWENCGRESNIFLYRVLAFREGRIIPQNVRMQQNPTITVSKTQQVQVTQSNELAKL